MKDGEKSEWLSVSEFRDDAVLRSNLFVGPLQGTELIAKIFETIRTICSWLAVLKHQRLAQRDIIIAKACLDDGQATAIEAVCLRDDEGWIYSTSLRVEPIFVAALLANRLAIALGGTMPKRNTL